MLTHRDETAASLARIKDQFASKLLCSHDEVLAISKHAAVDEVINKDTDTLYGIRIIPTPEHTNGSLCFYYSSPHGKNYLFTGDTIFQWDYNWSTLVINNAGGSDTALKNSLKKLRLLESNLVMSSGFVKGDAFTEVEADEWKGIIGTLLGQPL